MTYDEALQQLERWIRSSAGNPVPMPSGESYSFHSTGAVAADGIRRFEQKHGIVLPIAFRDFLLRVGPGRYFMDEYELGPVFYGLDDLEQHAAEVFETRENPFPKLLLVASFAGGEEGGFYLPRPSPDNFSVFSPDEEPGEWAVQTVAWSTFEEWMIALVQSGGDEIFP